MFRSLSILIVSPGRATGVLALEIHHSPNGPVSSLTTARDAARQARASGDQSDARVVVKDGLFAMTEAVVFEPRDRAITLEAAV
jgi:hypothetical protein